MLVPERTLPFHNNPPVTLPYAPVTPILKENPAPPPNNYYSFFDNYFLDFLTPKCMYTHANQYFNVDQELLIIIILKQTLPEQEKTAAVRN